MVKGADNEAMDREKYIDVLSKKVKAVKECNEDAPIKISLECIEDILELLKEQEAKHVEVCGQMFTIKYGHCPKCGKGIDSEAYPHWCGFCGQEVKWK